ncbi:MAG: non-homologous end-joining DNA ligase [Acidimicrobiia bacterium]
MIRFGISGLPPEGMGDSVFLGDLSERGHKAYELAFVTEFPWKPKRCREFGEAAVEHDIWLSAHAPYFAVLTPEDEDRAKQCRAALEHTIKLGRELGARVIVAHLGATHDETPEALLDRVRRHLDWIGTKAGHLGVGLGLETAGKASSFGSLGDIALLAEEFPFVRPVVDWAHVHAMSGGALTSPEAFVAVIEFLRDQFPGWMIDPLHCQFTDNEFGPSGEIRHVPYGTGSLAVGPLVQAARETGLRMTLISEAREDESHEAIALELGEAEASDEIQEGEGRLLGSGRIEFPDLIRVTSDGSSFVALDLERPLVLSNVDKPFFPDGYTKGDLIQFYESIAPLLLPHLSDRAIVMARFPDGAEGHYFYEKQAPGHQPSWMVKAPLYSSVRSAPIEFLMAPDRESLMWFANMACIEIHPWLSKVSASDRPNYAVFDLDPAEGATWEQVVSVAQLVRVALENLGLEGVPKTSGASGIHIYVPLEPEYDYARVRGFVEATGRLLAKANPDDVTMEWDIPKRAGRVFIDHNQNVAGKTIASVYSVRPLSGAPVSTPILWEELDTVHPGDFTMATIWDRVQRYGDLFAPALRGEQRLEAAEHRLGLA